MSGAAVVSGSDLLSRFVEAADTSSRRAALIDLVKTKQLHKVATTESFGHGLEQLARSAGRDGSNSERLLAVATLQRAAASAPPVRKTIRALMGREIKKPLAHLHELADLDDRLYAAKSWRVVPSAWSLDSLAAAAAREESGEAARRECVAGLVALADDVSGAISFLRKWLLGVRFETKRPGDSFGRRVSRVLVALTVVLSETDKPVGERAGRELSDLLDRGSRAAGRPESPAVRASVVEQVALWTHAIVRIDSSQGGRHRTYEALSVVSEWFSPQEWHEVCHSSKAIARVAQDVREALLRLVREGTADDGLRRVLVTVSGSRQEADALCRTMAKENPGIPDDLRDWLAGVSKRTSIASAVDSQERSIDEVLAELHIAMTRLTRAAARVRSDVLPEVSIVLPQQEQALSRVTGLVDAMANKLSLAVEWRSLRLRGSVGDEVDYSPAEHQLDSGRVRSRRVRLLSPVVVRISEDRVPRVVLKAHVEPVVDRREQSVGTPA